MTKLEFICLLHDKLDGLPQQEIEERLSFYAEMIDDRIEEGFSEQEAVSDIGSIDDIATQIIADIPLLSIVKDNIKKKKSGLGAGTVVLLALGSPIWLSLVIAAFSVILALYVSLWSVIISLWSVFASLAACSLGGILSTVAFAITGNIHTLVAMVGASLICAGLAIFVFFGCRAATKGVLLLTKKTAIGIKNIFIRKERAQ